MSPQQTALAACCRRSVWCANSIASPHSQARVQLGCLAPLSDQCATKLPRSTLRPVCTLVATLHSQTSVQPGCPLHSQTSVQLGCPLHSQTSVLLESHTPLSGLVCKLDCYTYSLAKTRTATRALWEQCLLLPPPMLLASYWLSSTLRADSFDCSACDCDRIGLLEEIPRSGIQISASTKRATIGVRAPYATRRKLRYEANQVWMNTTFISQGPQSSGI